MPKVSSQLSGEIRLTSGTLCVYCHFKAFSAVKGAAFSDGILVVPVFP
jgi:hypothetical protein